MANEQQGQVGKVVQVMGAVVDIAFSDDQELPATITQFMSKMKKALFR